MVLANSPFVTMSKGQDQFSSFLLHRVGSSTPSSSGPALLCCPGMAKRPLSRALQLMRGRNSHPAPMSSGSALSTLSDVDGVEEGAWSRGYLSPTPAATWQMSNGDSSPMLPSLGLSYPYLLQQDWLFCAACFHLDVVGGLLSQHL